MASKNKRKTSSELEFQQFINFFEELSWLLDANKTLNFKNASKLLQQYRNLYMHNSSGIDRGSNAYNLIGVLPSLLRDNEIFQNNSQLVQFAEEVLGLSIPRWEKRSRNEIIGLIICEVEAVNKERLDTLALWADNILQNKNQVKAMQTKAEASGNLFSWNETIQKLVEAENE